MHTNIMYTYFATGQKQPKHILSYLRKKEANLITRYGVLQFESIDKFPLFSSSV
uniref:Uncharacterized protein n=1 Tax=Rhizophora mucronata TaxID=61149 RepID=A0A2P2JPB5_RHIMU